MENRRLQNELNVAVKENDKIQKMWMDEREDALKMKDSIKRLEAEKAFLMVHSAL